MATLPFDASREKEGVEDLGGVSAPLFRGLSFREIASTLGATEAACKMRLSRALERMRESLAEEGVEP